MTATNPRVLAILGSGETAPTMVTTHREVVARFGEPPRAVLLDTPYGFQENANDISARAVEYFRHRIQLSIEPVGFPGPLAVDPAERDHWPSAAALARLRAAGYVFAGPGSPSYAVAVWRDSPVPEALASKLAHGGAVVFASAAALTLGRFTLPVYEIYKVGSSLHWLDGLDLLGQIGLGPNCVVIPHFDNAEGGTHDTRFCYMGERRLAALEALLPEGAWILGIDEHTALVVDLDSGKVTVTGRGAITVRRHGLPQRIPAGSPLTVTTLVAAAQQGLPADRAKRERAGAPDDAGRGDTPPEEARPARSPLLAEVRRLEEVFETAVSARQSGEAVEAILRLDRTIAEWAGDTLQTDEPDRARAVLHTLIHRLGETASVGLRDPRDVLAPLVDGLIALRAELRTGRAWELADRLRERLTAAGIELRDTPGGTIWTLRR